MYQEKWYYSVWFISALMAFSFLLVPLIAGIVLIVLRAKAVKEARREWDQSGFKDYSEVNQKLVTLREDYATLIKQKQNTENELEKYAPFNHLTEVKKQLEQEIHSLESTKEKTIEELDGLNDYSELQKKFVATTQALSKEEASMVHISNKIAVLKSELVDLEEELLMQSFGFYQPKYGFDSSDAYQNALQEIRSNQKELVKTRKATQHSLEWTIGNDKKKGKEFILDTIKLTLRAFNNECDNIISKVKFNNIEASEKRILKLHTEINKLTDMQHVSIKQEYLNLKLQELTLKYEFEQQKQAEKEEQAEIREQMREEAKALKELEKAKEKVEKEEKHFEQALEKVRRQLAESAAGDQEKLAAKIQELEKQLAETQKNKEDVLYRSQNTRAGYVYIISNIGSFGEHVYKIGMTRRLEPLDRVRELGDASVPFLFDVHAMIFSDDAPTLENTLHRTFTHRRLNKINERKEFFHVTLEEIEAVVKENHNKTVQFTKTAIAEDYRLSQQMKDDLVSA